jgi:hypothetical protein
MQRFARIASDTPYTLISSWVKNKVLWCSRDVWSLRRRKWHKDWEEYIMRSVINCTLHEMLLFRTALGSTQPPVQRGTGTLFPVVKRRMLEGNHWLTSGAEVKREWRLIFFPHTLFVCIRIILWNIVRMKKDTMIGRINTKNGKAEKFVLHFCPNKIDQPTERLNWERIWRQICSRGLCVSQLVEVSNFFLVLGDWNDGKFSAGRSEYKRNRGRWIMIGQGGMNIIATALTHLRKEYTNVREDGRVKSEVMSVFVTILTLWYSHKTAFKLRIYRFETRSLTTTILHFLLNSCYVHSLKKKYGSKEGEKHYRNCRNLTL